MQLYEAEVEDTFAEAFEMWAARVVITAETPAWARIAAQSTTGFATSVIGCGCEAGIERELAPDETPDGRPGVSVLFLTVRVEDLGKRLLERIGQCVLTTATTACYNGLESDQMVNIGSQLRYFGDGYQVSKRLDGRRFWRVPVMDGEFLVEERFGVGPAVGGGNLILLGVDAASTLRAAEAAVQAMQTVPGVILPFPGGICRSGSKVGARRYKFLTASTNDAFCPTLRSLVPHTRVPQGLNCTYEIVIDGLSLGAVEEAMRRGLRAAAQNGARYITAGNYGGRLGPYRIHLHDLLQPA
ncbi:MAG: formylmethanofuran--tetrahydromethanopterin N-formyltransferase [Acidobacteria bacterium]|nr:formylmethanofuran--tetrahydromethanopterin N-formyltransferase [Acidobacteriota bacterium]MDW7984350.1 formylmethanofuran--tetrahydromethanopterin N-formyltransferase [Acidobacteriota bacterium]